MNHDGFANAADASLLLQYAAAVGSDTIWQAPYEVQAVANIGDIDSDGSISAVDAYFVLRYAALAGTGKQVTFEDLF